MTRCHVSRLERTPVHEKQTPVATMSMNISPWQRRSVHSFALKMGKQSQPNSKASLFPCASWTVGLLSATATGRVFSLHAWVGVM